MTLKIPNQSKIKILCSDDVFKVMQDILLFEEPVDQEKEHFWVISLNHGSRILNIELVSMGTVKAVNVAPMNTFRISVQKGAVRMILVHNHPSGDLKPSAYDKDLTDRLIQVGHILDIEVMDHVVISTNSYYSFADNGIMKELERSEKWVPQFELVKRIKNEAKQILADAVKKERDKRKAAVKKATDKGDERLNQRLITIAKKAKERGMPIADISDLTGLSKKEIEAIKIKKGK